MNREERPAELVDPGSGDSGYWPRFRGRVLVLAEPELERRRRRSVDTISAVMTSWSRTIVPAAVAVAVVAALLILTEASRESVATQGPVGVQELVESALTDDPIPALMSSDEGAFSVTMVDESF